jgi:hypothetical protein
MIIKDKIIKKFSSNLLIVIMLGLISTTTAWAAIQSSLHSGRAGDASSEYAVVLADANNMWITAEVKYRDDLTVWKDKRIRVLVDGLNVNDVYDDIKTSNGSYELYTFAMTCFYEDVNKQLPDCKPYMDALYDPYYKRFTDSEYWLSVAEIEGKHSSTLQMLTGLFAVALFLLGVTAVMQIKNLVAYLVMFSILLWLLGISILFSIPIIFL